MIAEVIFQTASPLRKDFDLCQKQPYSHFEDTQEYLPKEKFRQTVLPPFPFSLYNKKIANRTHLHYPYLPEVVYKQTQEELGSDETESTADSIKDLEAENLAEFEEKVKKFRNQLAEKSVKLEKEDKTTANSEEFLSKHREAICEEMPDLKEEFSQIKYASENLSFSTNSPITLSPPQELDTNRVDSKEKNEEGQIEDGLEKNTSENRSRKLKKTLLLDLDETLIHAKRCHRKLWNKKIGSLQTLQTHQLRIKFVLRPYALQFLHFIQNYYQVVLFTAATYQYVTDVIQTINDQYDLSFNFQVLCRHHCRIAIQNDKIRTKDLSLIKNRTLQDMILVDNSIFNAIFNIHNVVPIRSFLAEQNDQELIKLTAFLLSIHDADDVRIQIQQKYKLNQLIHFQKVH